MELIEEAIFNVDNEAFLENQLLQSHAHARKIVHQVEHLKESVYSADELKMDSKFGTLCGTLSVLAHLTQN